MNHSTHNFPSSCEVASMLKACYRLAVLNNFCRNNYTQPDLLTDCQELVDNCRMTCSKLVNGLLRDCHKIITTCSFSFMKNLSQACKTVLPQLNLVNKLVAGMSINILSDAIKTVIIILPVAGNRLPTVFQWSVTGLQQFF